MVNRFHFAPGHSIIREDDPGLTCYYIESGKVEVTKESNGRPIHIAFLGPGATFGEMSVVDDLPRSASVATVEESVISEFHREDLYAAMKDNPEVFGRFLRSIFERLREANRTIAAIHPDMMAQMKLAMLKEPGAKNEAWFLEALTPEAAAAITQNPCPLRSFPFKIGRKSDDPFLYNHMEIRDDDPAQIARHHVSIERDGNGRVGVIDRGSEHGTVVDGVRIGGSHGNGPVYFEGKGGTLVLGRDDSPFRFRVGCNWT
jgi:Cyclic nucleotide-binding domain/FHA domain